MYSVVKVYQQLPSHFGFGFGRINQVFLLTFQLLKLVLRHYLEVLVVD